MKDQTERRRQMEEREGGREGGGGGEREREREREVEPCLEMGTNQARTRTHCLLQKGLNKCEYTRCWVQFDVSISIKAGYQHNGPLALLVLKSKWFKE